jgi:hypothetical protein
MECSGQVTLGSGQKQRACTSPDTKTERAKRNLKHVNGSYFCSHFDIKIRDSLGLHKSYISNL